MSLYRSPDINRLQCLNDEMSTSDGHLGYTFPIGSYVKIMSADAGHLELRFGLGHIIFKVHHPRTTHANVYFKSLTGFRGKK